MMASVLKTLVSMKPNTKTMVKGYEVWKYVNKANSNERFMIRVGREFCQGVHLGTAVKWLEKRNASRSQK